MFLYFMFRHSVYGRVARVLKQNITLHYITLYIYITLHYHGALQLALNISDITIVMSI